MTKQTLPANYERILRLLPKGAERPITGREIAQLTKLSLRTVQEIISNLVTRYKILICAGRDTNGGYYLPANNEERLAGLRALDRQRKREEERLQVLMYEDLHREKEYL